MVLDALVVHGELLVGDGLPASDVRKLIGGVLLLIRVAMIGRGGGLPDGELLLVNTGGVGDDSELGVIELLAYGVFLGADNRTG